MTTYLSAAVRDLLDRAQADVDHHITAGRDGRCLACDRVQPCPALEAAHATFARFGRLPVRRPGLAARAVRAGPASGWLERVERDPPVARAG